MASAEHGRCRRERIEDRLVADRRSDRDGRARLPRPRASGRDQSAVEGRGVAGSEPGLDEGGAVERAGRATDRGHEAMADGPQQLPGERVGGQLAEHVVDGSEPDDEVVAVVAVAENRVEPGQRTTHGGRRRRDSEPSPRRTAAASMTS